MTETSQLSHKMKKQVNRRKFIISSSIAGAGVFFPGFTGLAFNHGLKPDNGIVVLPKGQKQIFVDSQMVAKTQNIERKVHPAKKLQHPVLEANMPWEQGRDYDGKKDRRVYIYGSVIRDKETGEFRMWYNRLKSNFFATSPDGINWARPNLGQLGETNEIDLFHFHSPSIIKDNFEKDPEKRYKALGSVKSSIPEEEISYLKSRFKEYAWYKRSSAYSAAYSADGLNWKLYPHPIILGGDTITLSQDPVSGEYLAFHKNKSTPDDKRRKVFLSTSKNMQDWTSPVLVMEADDADHKRAQLLEDGTHSEIYNMSAFPYGGQWLGLITVFRRAGAPKVKGPGQSGNEGPIDVLLVHSRNGRDWSHCSDHAPVIGLGPYDYDSGSILGLCNAPVVVGNEMWMYYTAMTTTHGGYLPDKQMSIARAAWRLDGMVSFSAGKDGGVFETCLLKPEGTSLCVNYNAAKGSLLVEVCDPKGKTLQGFSKDECIMLKGDSTKQKVKWEKYNEIPTGVPVRLRFYLKEGDLFSYLFE